MPSRNTLEVRPLAARDIPLIADYWLRSDRDFLVGMGVDLGKLPTREQLTAMLTTQVQLPDTEKASLALIAEIDGRPSGHCKVNNITYGQEATMHLHLWQADSRRKGLGTAMVQAALPVFFERLQLKTIRCEPYALNPAPNRTL